MLNLLHIEYNQERKCMILTISAKVPMKRQSSRTLMKIVCIIIIPFEIAIKVIIEQNITERAR